MQRTGQAVHGALSPPQRKRRVDARGAAFALQMRQQQQRIHPALRIIRVRSHQVGAPASSEDQQEGRPGSMRKAEGATRGIPTPYCGLSCSLR